MKLISRIGFGLVMFIASYQIAYASNNDEVVAEVAGRQITKDLLDIAQKELSERLPAMSEAQLRDYLVAYIADLFMLAEVAKDRDISERESYQERLDYAREQILVEMLLEDIAEQALTEEAIQAAYDDGVSQLQGEEEVRARHILVATEEEAKEIKAQLDEGAEFEALALDLSQDPGSAANGGDLGFFTKERMVRPFAETAFALNIGEISPPVRSQFGWHIIKIEEKRERPVPTLDEVRGQLEVFVKNRAQAEFVQELRDNNEVQRFDQPEEEAVDDAEGASSSDEEAQEAPSTEAETPASAN